MNWDKEQALVSVDGDLELLEDLLLVFKDSCVADLARIEIAYKMQNWAGISDAAHSIKGAALAMGFEDIHSCSATLEREVLAGTYNDVLRNYNQLQEYVSYLDELIESPSR